ncbi:PilW family protein [Frateuria sp.]|uniref:PilW family protein n=1 Tax=Frateuria sp. TaxID=2211372 RepID=UPI001808CDFC|nr:PilW family protein [Frateuria sp.]NUR22528.1 prepilin-type N-terminal cleavage/methylation domain-containing protein [Frateuria sp.]
MRSPREQGIARFRRAAGFSLVEMMIAMVLGLIVVAGLIQVLLANRKSYQLQQGTNILQQNVRFASDRLGWSLRMADFWGGNSGGVITGSPAVTARGSCDQAWILDTQHGLYGYEGGASFPIANCVDDADYVKGSDVLVARYVDADGMDPAASSTIAASPKQVYLVSAIGQQAALFLGNTAVPTTPPASAIGRYVYPYHVDMYYLRPCSNPAGGTNATHCDAADDNGSPIPTLMRMRLDSTGSLTEEPLVEGIEQLQFQYGITGTDVTQLVPANYKDASAVTADEWRRVITVSVGLVAVSQQRDISMPHVGTFGAGNCSYQIKNGSTVTTGCANFSVAGSQPWQFARTQLTQVVQLRNRIRMLVASQ